ncbi:MAG: response regulator [Desulfobacteraceae bacterium]|nr:response regulator [Desulfobacteraceae bacterium]
MEKHKILLIDDDPATLDMISQALESRGYQVTTADGGEAVLDLISRKGFDLVLTDMVMEPVGGPKVLRRTKEISPDTMVMILTGRGDVDLAGEALRLKADEYLYKPPDLGKLFFKVASCLDKLRLKRKIAQAEERLRQAQQAQAIGTLAGGIAHEFNNILWIIMANAELAASTLPEGNTAHKNLQRVEKACSRGADLVQQILSFSRQGEYRPRPLDIMPIVKESLKFLRSSIPTTIEIRQNISTRSATIMSDPSQVHQTLINLCTNAADAMGEKPGVLEISMTDVELDQDERGLHHDLAPGKYVRLSVKDTGIGMEPKVRTRIFEPFFTTKGVGERRGMGLAVVHGIVKSCEGTIEVHSEPGKGSTFHLFFPKIEKGTKPGPGAFISSVKGKERILFVDDDKEIANMGKEILEGYGYRVESKTCSEEALETFRDRPDKFDLIITDMIMPKMTGEELVEEFVRIRPDIPIILCTGYDEETYKERAREIGIKEVIMKPLNGRDLANAIRKALKENLESQNIGGKDIEGKEEG